MIPSLFSPPALFPDYRTLTITSQVTRKQNLVPAKKKSLLLAIFKGG